MVPSASHSSPDRLKRHVEFFSTSPTKKQAGSPHRSAKRLCPVKFEASPGPLRAAWNSFVPLNFCSMPFEMPVRDIQEMVKKIQQKGVLAPHEVQASILAKIVELAHILQPNVLAHYKKGTVLKDPVGEYADKPGLAGSFYVVSFADRVYACIPNSIEVGEGTLAKVRGAVGLVFSRINGRVQFDGKLDAAKHSIVLEDANGIPLPDSIQRTKARIQAGVDLHGVPHVVSPYFFGLSRGKHGLKMVTMYPRFEGDMFTHFTTRTFEPEECRINTAILAVQMAQALQGIHSKGYVHMDFKIENILFNCKPSSQMLERLGLIDFDLSKAMKPGVPTVTPICGTLQFVAPEMAARAFHLDEFFNKLGISDPLTLMGPSLDNWGLGLVLYFSFNNEFPEYVDLLTEFENTMQEAEKPENLKMKEQLLIRAEEIKARWFEVILKKLEKEKDFTPPAILSLESFIASLLMVDPRKRLDDKKIQEAIIQLKEDYSLL